MELENSNRLFKRTRRHALRLPHYRVEEIKPLGNNPAVTDYLRQCCVCGPAQSYLSEVYYFVEDEKKERKYFFAAGWKNELDGWEVSAPVFRGCLGHRAITFIGRDYDSLSVFTDCFDYLSWLGDNPFAVDSIVILNAPGLLQSAARKARAFSQISTFFCRDDAGKMQSAEFTGILPQATDRSVIYKGYRSYNEMIIKRMAYDLCAV
jgi:hypothetical protein